MDKKNIQTAPLHLLLIIGIAIFVSEFIAMIIIDFLPRIQSKIIEATIDATFLVILVSPSLYFFLFRPLLINLKEREKTAAALLEVKNELEDKVVERTAKFKEANEQLNAWAKELEQHNSETYLLSQMVDLLQTSLQFEELYLIISQFAAKLFPNDSGTLFIFRSSRNLVEPVTVWGPSENNFAGFHPDECWALRRGQINIVSSITTGQVCKHMHNTPGIVICIPMMAHGEALGMLNLLLDHSDIDNIKDSHIAAKQRLLTSMSEHIGLAIANLRLRETLKNLSIRDSLTGLYNRRYMEESLEREQSRAERNKSALGIIMIDVDHFKRFNDTYGHKAGDIVLHEIGKFLLQTVRGNDIACRYGGEEFVLILSDMRYEDALNTLQQRADFLRLAIKQHPMHFNAQPLSVTLSLGFAMFTEHGTNAHMVLQAADAALYAAKKSGRDMVCEAKKKSNSPLCLIF